MKRAALVGLVSAAVLAVMAMITGGGNGHRATPQRVPMNQVVDTAGPHGNAFVPPVGR
jgi:hypothetical protein